MTATAGRHDLYNITAGLGIVNAHHGARFQDGPARWLLDENEP
jgi:hypothetical protein